VFDVIVKAANDGDAEDEDLPQVTLRVTYTPEYPAEVRWLFLLLWIRSRRLMIFDLMTGASV